MNMNNEVTVYKVFKFLCLFRKVKSISLPAADYYESSHKIVNKFLSNVCRFNSKSCKVTINILFAFLKRNMIF